MLDPENPIDQATLLEACRLHPRAAAKGLDTAVRVNTNAAGNGYVAILADGRCETFSKKYVGKKQKPTSAVRQSEAVTQAFRNEVLDQTRGFRLSSGLGGCDTVHVGHVGKHEFAALVSLFCREKGIQRNDIALEKRLQRSHHEHKEWYFKDDKLAAEWAFFHRHHAQLEMQSARENLSRPRQQVSLS